MRAHSRMTGISAVVALCVTMLPLSGAAATVEGSFERTLTVNGPVDLDVRTGSGSITVATGPAGVVTVKARIRAWDWFGLSGRRSEERVREIEKNPPIEQQGNAIRIGRIQMPDWFRNVSISYELVVPGETMLGARSGSGSVSIDGVKRSVRASTGSGSMRFGAIGGGVDATTGSGSIVVESADGGVRASTGSGGIRARGVAGAVTAKTGSGSIEIVQTGPGDVEMSSGSGQLSASGVRGAVRAHASSGSVHVDGEPRGTWDVSSSSGSITVRVPRDAAFDLDARTGSGRIDSDQPVTMTGTIGRRTLMGKVRGGGPRLELRTSSGSIHVM